MDSCHIFNFLFGTKKATTELSKCFTHLTSQRRSKTNRRSNDYTNQASNCPQSTAQSTSSCNHRDKSLCTHELPKETSPPSPLKQVQMKLTGLAPAFYAKFHQHQDGGSKNKGGATCNVKCGTYRATYVELAGDSIPDERNGSIETQKIHNNEAKENESNANKHTLIIDESEEGTQNSHSTIIVENPSNSYDHESNASELYPSLDKTRLDLAENDAKFRSQQSVAIVNDQHSYASNLVKNMPIDENNNDLVTDQKNTDNPNSFNRVIMYDDSNFDLRKEQEKFVASSAQVYKLFSENGEARVKLRRVSSVSVDGQVENHPIEDEEIVDKIERKIEYQEKNRIDKKKDYVRNLVNSFENGTIDNEKEEYNNHYGFTKPVTVVKPMPPPPPPKHIIRGVTSRKRSLCLSYQLKMNKPLKIRDLFIDEEFLKKYFFDKLEPIDRCIAAQVCRTWRNVLYSNQDYWKGLVNVIDCTQLRREHLVECIMNTIQSARSKQREQQKSIESLKDRIILEDGEKQKQCSIDSYFNFDLDQDDIWKIQELCNKFTTNHYRIHSQSSRQHLINSDNEQTNNHSNNCIANSKSSSIPSQISSTMSSVSLSSLLSPLSESSRIDSIKEKLYTSLDYRGFDALCLFGANDEDIEELVYKIPANAHKRITVSRLNNCSFTDRGLTRLLTTFYNIEELELSGCNEITNTLELKELVNLRRLIITDCINIADGFVQTLIQVAHQLTELTIQAYHLTDAFLEYMCSNSDTSNLTRLELPNCKELTNQSLITMAKHLDQLEVLSISGSTKISDDGIEILVERSRQLKTLDLSWCTRITDASLECIACTLGDRLTDLILDRNVHITDIGIGYLSTMSKLTLLYIRWCPQITDIGLESLITMKTLEYLSLAGINQITGRSLLCLVETNLIEVELTNCSAVNNDLIMFLAAQMPRCNIIF